MVKGLASATHEAFANPGLVLLVLAVTVLSAGFHEFGHAAAARRGGATPGAMGAGLYLIWPAFYTDVTDSYRLGRGGRIRTDLGGLYFNAIVAVAIMGLWWATGFDALLLVVVTQILQMVRQLLPLVRFDGYHILADATGVPDLFQRIKPTLLGLLPWRRKDPAAQVLKPWARAVVTAWVLVTVPLLVFSLVMMVLVAAPAPGHRLGQRPEAVRRCSASSLAAGDIAGAAVRALAIAAVALPVLGILYILLRLVRQLTTGLWQKTRGKPCGAAAAMAAVAAVTAGLAWAWWPASGHLPAGPAVRTRHPGRRHHRRLSDGAVLGRLREGQAGRTVALWPAGASEADARTAAAEHGPGAPRRRRTGGAGTGGGCRTAGARRGAVVGVSLRPPAAPEEDGNQALAVNTTDGSVAYDVAFALVWAEDGETVGHRQRGLRLRQLHRLRRRGRRLPGGADRGPGRRDRAREPVRGRELQLPPVPDLRAGHPAGPHPGRTAERRTAWPGSTRCGRRLPSSGGTCRTCRCPKSRGA